MIRFLVCLNSGGLAASTTAFLITDTPGLVLSMGLFVLGLVPAWRQLRRDNITSLKESYVA